MLRRIGRWIARVLLGLFVVWQLAFLVGLNFCEVTRHYVGSVNEAAEAFPSLLDPDSPAAKRLAKLEQVFTRWSELTEQRQKWSLFAPNVWENVPFVAVEFRWDEEPANGRAAAGLVGGLAGPGPLPTTAVWAATAPRPPVILLSDNEPRDVRRYFRVGLFRLRRFEGNFDVNLQGETDKTVEDMHDVWRPKIRGLVHNEGIAIRAYLEWRWRQYEADHPDVETPRQVVLHLRTYRIPAPSESEPLGWEGPEDVPLARWRPHFSYAENALPVEVHDLVAERFDVMP
jgi:hypothetical protein